MLHIKHKHQLDFPHITFSASHPMKLSSIPADDDELAQAIVNDPVDHDDDWQLTDRPDTEQLEKFWTTVEEEIKADPTWVDFAKE